MHTSRCGPLAVALAIPLRSTLTMARLKLCQLLIQVFLPSNCGLLRLAGYDNDLPGLVDFHASNTHTGRDHGLDSPSHISLAEG